MIPRKWYAILGAVAGTGWVLFFGAFAFIAYIVDFHQNYDYSDRIFDVAPSEEALKKLEAAGVTRNEVEQLTQNITEIALPQDESNTYIFECDERIKTGDISREEFLTCAEFIQTYYKHIALFLENSTGLTNILNYTRYWP